jgi:hypothetical protein
MLSLPHTPVPGLVVLSVIVTVAVICSVCPTRIVELGEVTSTLFGVGVVVVGFDGPVGFFLQAINPRHTRHTKLKTKKRFITHLLLFFSQILIASSAF